MHKVTESVVRSENRCRDSAAEFLDVFVADTSNTVHYSADELGSAVYSRIKSPDAGIPLL